MASKRFVAILKNSDGVTNTAAPIAYDREADALAAAILAAPAGGYIVLDSWKLDYVADSTTATTLIQDLSINESEAINYYYQPSETWPI
jgi:hypothetical protein